MIARLHDEINLALNTADVKEKMVSVGGAEAWATTREFFAGFIKSEYERYGRIVREIGIKID